MTRLALVLALGAAALGCKKEPAEAGAKGTGASPVAGPATPAGPPAKGKGRVRVAVSVDWEGAYFSTEGLDALDRFRVALPDVPLSHFVCPAYFTKPGADRQAAIDTLRDALRPGDELGVHVHAWKTLVEAAGVAYRASPSFLTAELMTFDDGDQGFEVELAAYSTAEVRAIVAHARRLLVEAGFDVKPHFRAGGFMSSPGVLEALRAEGYRVDSSSTDPAWLEGKLDGAALPGRIRALWPKVDQTTQPFAIATPAGEILELPISAALDYVEPPELVAHVRRALAVLDAAPDRDVFVELGFHQETAQEFAPKILRAVTEMRAEGGARLVFETLSASAAAVRARPE